MEICSILHLLKISMALTQMTQRSLLLVSQSRRHHLMTCTDRSPIQQLEQINRLEQRLELYLMSIKLTNQHVLIRAHFLFARSSTLTAESLLTQNSYLTRQKLLMMLVWMNLRFISFWTPQILTKLMLRKLLAPDLQIHTNHKICWMPLTCRETFVKQIARAPCFRDDYRKTSQI